MELERRYQVWRARHREGWGRAWFLAAALAERFGARSGVTLVPLHREGVGWYGLLVQCGEDTLGRLTAGGDVERWTGSEHDRRSLPDDPAKALPAAIAQLGLDRLSPRPDARAGDAATIIRVLARVALQVPTGAFSVLAEGDHVVLHGPSAEIPLDDVVHRVLRGESEEALAAEILDRLGFASPPRDATYTLTEHRHRYAVWCAARAAGRKLEGATNRAVRLALEASGLPEVVAGPVERWPSSAAEFDRKHHAWCAELVTSLHGQGVDGATFGRAAKIVAIYLKTLIVCGGHDLEPLAAIAHPPIDRVLLQALAREERFAPTIGACGGPPPGPSSAPTATTRSSPACGTPGSTRVASGGSSAGGPATLPEGPPPVHFPRAVRG